VPHLTATLSATSAAVVEILIAPSVPLQHAMKALGRQPCPALRVRGLIDTGASHTIVDPAVLKQLEVTSKGSTPIYTTSTGADGHA
jgi:hypothetical protein